MSVPGLSLNILKRKNKEGVTSPRDKDKAKENDGAGTKEKGSGRRWSAGRSKTPRGDAEKKEVIDISSKDEDEGTTRSRNSFDSATELKPVKASGDASKSQPVDTRLAKIQKGHKPRRKGSMILDSLSLEDINQNSPVPRRKKKKKKSEGAVKKEEPIYHYFVLRVEEARGLRKGLIGHINPYCTFDIIPSGIIGARTGVVKWDSNPRWNDQFVGNRYFGLDGKPKPESFVITVMDKNSLSSDEFLGKAVIPFSKSIDQWFPLQGERAQGELRVVLRFYTSKEGSRLYNIFKEETDMETLCARWEKEVVAMQDEYLTAEKQEDGEKEGETPVRIPPLDVPAFINVNKIWTLFQLAVFKDKPDLVKHLHELGCNINARDQTGNTALHIAAVKKLQAQMRQLVRFGVDTKALNYLGGKDYKEMMAMFKDDDDDLGSYNPIEMK